jgi:hypothetical protein
LEVGVIVVERVIRSVWFTGFHSATSSTYRSIPAVQPRLEPDRPLLAALEAGLIHEKEDQMNTADIQQRFAAGEGDCFGTVCFIPESGNATRHKLALVCASKEHAAVLENPNQFESLHRKNDFLAEGVHTVFGVKHGEAQLQAFYFPAAQFTSAAATTWLRDRGFEPLVFTAATVRDTATVEPSKVHFLHLRQKTHQIREMREPPRRINNM